MSFLNEILSVKQEEVAHRKRGLSQNDLRSRVMDLHMFTGMSLKEVLCDSEKLSVIAEVKGASPSQGVMNADFDPLDVAKGYERSGAAAISVLTDQKYFNGHRNYLQNIAMHVEIPCLQKDFFIDPYQIYESKILGARAFLIIVRMLSRSQIEDFLGLGHELGLDALVEVHDEADIAKVADCKGVEILGINNRNLDDMTIDVERCLRMKESLVDFDLDAVPVKVAESGLSTVEDLRMVREHGFDAVLMGSALMKTGDPAETLRELLK